MAWKWQSPWQQAISILLRDEKFNYRWKKAAKRLLPARIQLELRKRVLAASLEKDNGPLESDAEGVKLLIRKGDFVIDAGANIGTYTKLLSALVGPSGSVWAFEPLPENHGVLAYTADRLKLENVKLHRCALSDFSGSSYMEIPVFSQLGESLYDARLVASKREGLRTLEVPVTTLDAILPEGSPVAFIKIDVEGHELQCLKGALGTLRTHRPRLLIESFEHPGDEGSASNLVVRFLSAEGYDPWVFTSAGFMKWDQTSHPQNLFFLSRGTSPAAAR